MPAESVFVDTCGLIALLNASDRLHRSTLEVWAELGRRRLPLVLTDWILAETGNGLARTVARARFPTLVETLEKSDRVETVGVDDPLRNQALALFANHGDKTWGLVDCASFVVMRELGIMAALTNDRHFEQAGFECLLPHV